MRSLSPERRASLARFWIHDGRHYQNLEPCVPRHRELLAAFRKCYWDFYKQLRAYRTAPTPERATQLREQFDALFSTVTGYDALDQHTENQGRRNVPADGAG